MHRSHATRVTLLATLLTACATLASGCSDPAAPMRCDFNDDCARPYEYCDFTSSACTPYACIEDSQCLATERCNTITKTCVLRPKPDMGPDLDMPPAPVDMPPDMPIPPPEMNLPEMNTPEMPPQEMDLGDRTPPTIHRVSPTQASTLTPGQPLSLTITFSEPMDPGTIGPVSISLSADEGQPLPAEIVYDEATYTATLTLTEPLPQASHYTLSVLNIARDIARNRLTSTFQAPYYPPFLPAPDHHAIATRWAPVLHQELLVVSAPRHDLPARLDYDGDWRASNNALNAANDSDPEAHVYYLITTSPTHIFIYYIFYYTTRRSLTMGAMQDSEHDLTGAVFVVERARDLLLLIEGLRVESSTDLLLAHIAQGSGVDLPGEGRLKVSFTADQLEEGRRFPLYIPAGRHETCSWYASQVRQSADTCQHPAQGWVRGPASGVILRVADAPQPFSQATREPDQPYQMAYALLPFEEAFGQRASYLGPQALFDRTRPYQPDGERPDRPEGAESALALPLSLPSAADSTRGKSPYRWLTQPARSNDGQWLIDPAWTLKQRYVLPEPWSLDYCRNLFLGIDQPEDATCPPLVVDTGDSP